MNADGQSQASGDDGRINGKESDVLIERLRIFWESIVSVEEKINTDEKSLWQEEQKTVSNPLASLLLPIMEALPHLHFPQGTVLDYFRQGDSMGSEPVLYVRWRDAPRVGDDHNAVLLGFNILRAGPAPEYTDVMKVVQPDRTAEGAWELFLLNLLGVQFGLHWHACYHLLRMVYDWHELLEENKYFGREMRGEFLMAASQLSAEDRKEVMSWDCRPSAVVEKDRIILGHCVFSPFIGFIKASTAVVFEPELQIMSPVIEKRLECDCGIKY